MARLSVSFDDIWANIDFPDQITLGKQVSFTKTTNSPGDIGIALSIYSPDINLVSSDVQGPGIDRHKLTLQIDLSATSTSFTVPLSSWAEVTNKNKITFQIEATAVTTSGLGTTARTTVYAVADQSMAPTFTLGVSPSSGVIQVITPVTISISGESCKYGASVASRSINADSRSSGGSSLSITPISNGVIAVSATVKDSRGLSTTKTATFSVTAYSPPTLRSFSVARVDSSGATDPEGTSVKFSVAWESGSGDTGGNSCTVKYRQAGVGAYVDCDEVISGDEYVITETFSTDYEYEFIAVIADKHRPIEKHVILERGFFTLDFRAGGDGMAIGQACTEPGLTINMPTKFKKPISEISFDDTGANGGWIGAKTQFDKVPIHFSVPHKVDGSRFDPLIAGKDVNGNYWAFGQGAGQEICFVGFKAGRTENGIDWKVSINTLTGAISAPGLSLAAYPVGSIYISYNSTSPASLFGGSWTPLSGFFPFFNTSVDYKTHGSATHTLSISEMPSHSHTIRTNDGTNTWPRYYKTNAKNGDLWNLLAWNSSNSGGNGQPYLTNTGGGGAHNNMPPYQNVYAWYRTA